MLRVTVVGAAEGARLGVLEGARLGERVGARLGDFDGDCDPGCVGECVVGSCVGWSVGDCDVGDCDVGDCDVGDCDVGDRVVGCCVGEAVGTVNDVRHTHSATVASQHGRLVPVQNPFARLPVSEIVIAVGVHDAVVHEEHVCEELPGTSPMMPVHMKTPE